MKEGKNYMCVQVCGQKSTPGVIPQKPETKFLMATAIHRLEPLESAYFYLLSAGRISMYYCA